MDVLLVITCGWFGLVGWMFGSFCLFRWGIFGLFAFWLVFILARFDCALSPSSLIVSNIFPELL